MRAELAAQLEREREMREHLEKQLNEEQKIRSTAQFQKPNGFMLCLLILNEFSLLFT